MASLRLLCVTAFLALACAVLLLPSSAAPPKPDDSPRDPSAEPEGGVVLEEAEEGKPRLVLDTGGHRALILGAFVLKEKDKEGKEKEGNEDLLTVSHDGSIRFWDLDGGLELQRALYPPLGNLWAAAYHAPTNTLALAGAQQKEPVIRLLNLETGAFSRTVLKGHKASITSIAFSPDGKWLAGTNHNVPVHLWDVKEGKLLKVLDGLGSQAHRVLFNTGSGRLVTASLEAGVRFWTVPDGKPLTTIPITKEFDKDVKDIDFSPDGSRIAVGSQHGAYIWDTAKKTSERISEFRCHEVAFSADGNKLLFGVASPKPGPTGAASYDLKSKKTVQLNVDNGWVGLGGFLPQGKRAITMGGDRHEIFLWNVGNGKLVHRRGGAGRMRYSAGWSADGKSIAWGISSDEGNTFQGTHPLRAAFSLEKFQPLSRKADLDTLFVRARRAQLTQGKLTLEKLNADTLVITGGKDKVQFQPGWPVMCASFVRENRAVVGTKIGRMMLIDTSTGKILCNFESHLGGVTAVAVSPDGRFLLSASTDETLRIWNLKDADEAVGKAGLVKPMLSLFVAGQDWIAWTPQGYYAASPDGDRFVGWRTGKGTEKFAGFYPAEQFQKIYYRPDVIKAVLKEGGLDKVDEKLFVVKKGDTAKDAKPIAVEDVLPPEVVIAEPKRSAITLFKEDKSQVTIKAEAILASKESKDPVTGMQLLIDGAPYDREKGIVPKPAAEWSVKVPPGKHRLTVVAQTAKGQGETELWVNNLAEPELPRLFVLAIGNNDYKKESKLTCATKDAAALKGAFDKYSKDKKLFSDVKTKVIENASRKDILEELDGLKKEQMTADDVAVIFYSGHGGYDKDKNLFWLLAVEADSKDYPKTAVSGEELKERLSKLPCRRMLLLLDACHSGGLGGIEDLTRSLKQSDCGVVAICSSTSEEKSWENDKKGQGYFTLMLMEALEGKAGANPAGEITVSRLALYVEENVPKATDEKQHPVVGRPLSLRPFALAKPPLTP